MSQRESGYERKERDLYETPEWVTEALIPHLPRRPGFTWEPAMGGGKMVRAFSNNGLNWYGSDIDSGDDFLLFARVPSGDIDAVITNPPYELGSEFCEHALKLMESCGGQVAMLMRTDFDHAKSRSHLFRDCPAFAKKVVLTKRIVWFEPEPGSKGKSPSFNHAWFIWDWKHEGPPTIGYANGVPMEKDDGGPAKLPLAGGGFAVVSTADFAGLSEFKWRVGANGYVYRAGGRRKGEQCLLHRIVMQAPRGQDVHHLDENKLNCMRENLVLVSPREHQKHHLPALVARNESGRRYDLTGICKECGNHFVKDRDHRSRHVCCSKLCTITRARRFRKGTVHAT